MGQESVHDSESVCVVQHLEEGWLALFSFHRILHKITRYRLEELVMS